MRTARVHNALFPLLFLRIRGFAQCREDVLSVSVQYHSIRIMENQPEKLFSFLDGEYYRRTSPTPLTLLTDSEISDGQCRRGFA